MNEISADTAFKKKGLDLKTNHQDLTKAKIEEIFVLTTAIEEKETAALKLEQSAKEVRDKCNRGSEFGVACTLVLGARGYKPRSGEEIRPLYGQCTHYQKHYANDADELERYGLFKESKASVAQRDDMKRLRSEDDEKHKEHIDHDSNHDKTVASLLAQLDDVDSKLHNECVITVREECSLHIVFCQKDVPDGMRPP